MYCHVLSSLQGLWILAEREGFEPSRRCRQLIFETSALNHSAISPKFYNYSLGGNSGRGSEPHSSSLALIKS